MSALRRVENIVTIEATLTAVVALLLAYVGFSASAWIESTDTRLGSVEDTTKHADIERAAMRTEASARWEEVLRRLNSIDAKLSRIEK